MEKIYSLLTTWLNREPTYSDLALCCELIFNYYVSAICNRIRCLIRQNKKPDILYLYIPVINGILKKAKRNKNMDNIKFTPIFKKIFCVLAPNKSKLKRMTESEILEIVNIYKTTTDLKIIKEAKIDAKKRGIDHIKYIGVIIKGRIERKRMAMKKPNRLKNNTFIGTPIDSSKAVDSWNKTLEKTVNDSLGEEIR